MGWNDNSRTGYKGNPTNCGLIAMSNLGLRVDRTHYRPKSGMYNEDILNDVNRQARCRLWYKRRWWRRKVTTEQFSKKHQKGLFLVFVKDHVGVLDRGLWYNMPQDEWRNKPIMYAYLVARKSTRIR